MKKLSIGDNQSGFQKVVWDHVSDVLAGGVHIDPTSLTGYTEEPKYIPAGTLISVRQSDGMHKVVTITAGATEDDPATFGDLELLGMLHFDVPIDDMPLGAVVLAGTARKDALPEDEAAAWGTIKTILTRISAV